MWHVDVYLFPPQKTTAASSVLSSCLALSAVCRVVSCDYLAMIRGVFVAQLLAGFLETFTWASPSSVPSRALNKPTTPLLDEVHGGTDSPLLPRLVTPISGQVSFKTKTRNGVRGKRRYLRVTRVQHSKSVEPSVVSGKAKVAFISAVGLHRPAAMRVFQRTQIDGVWYQSSLIRYRVQYPWYSTTVNNSSSARSGLL